MIKIQAIKNHIIFKFEDQTVRKTDTGRNRSQFNEITKWGFEISSYDEGTKKPRWGRVVSVGKDVIEDIKVNSRVLIEPLKWTEGVKFQGETLWRTDETWILALDEG